MLASPMAPRTALPLLVWAGVALGAPLRPQPPRVHPRPPAPSGPNRPCNRTLQLGGGSGGGSGKGGKGPGGGLPDVVNGEKVEGFPYPWLAWQGDDNIGQFCGGTLIAPDWVLTAAHCLYDTLPPEHSVRIEVHRRDYSVPIGQEDGAARRVIAAHPHPNYDAGSLFYDIALLQLNESVPASIAAPVKLSDGQADVPGDAMLAGWGSLDVACREYGTIMEQGEVDIETREICEAMAGRWYDHETQVCAGRELPSGEWIEAGCGDSGGPLFVRAEDSAADAWVQVGVVSWGYGDSPNVYTRVSAFRSWIESFVGGLV